MYPFIILAFIPVIIFTIIASIKVKTTYNKYSKQLSQSRLSGAQAARQVLYSQGVTDVAIHEISGELTDHYNPRDNSLNLSSAVYHGTDVAAIGVACHEAGHALQYANAYLPIKIRNAIIPITNFGSRFSGLFVMAGILLSVLGLHCIWIAEIGVILFGCCTLFQLITLPTEFNASRRAMRHIQDCNILTRAEQKGTRKVLTAAAMTYVAALAVSLLELLRLIYIVNGHRD